MKHTKQIAYLRQLCCLGLPKDAVMAEFLTAVKSVIPSNNNVYTPVDEHGFPTYSIMDNFIPELMDLAAEVLPQFFAENIHHYIFMDCSKVHNDPTFYFEDFYNTDLYNLIYRPAGQFHVMMAQIKANGQVAGRCFLFRDKTAKPFFEAEIALYNQLLPYLSHALSVKDAGQTTDTYIPSGQFANLLVNGNGLVQHCSILTEKLLFLAGFDQKENCFRLDHGHITPPLSQLCLNLKAIFNHGCAPPPELIHTNVMGRFIFRAYWLNPIGNDEQNLVSIVIEHEEPLSLLLYRGLQNLPLSTTQKQVAFLAAKNMTSEAICKTQHIKRSTLKDHLDKIFLKLDIHCREDLRPLLLAKQNTKMHDKRL